MAKFVCAQYFNIDECVSNSRRHQFLENDYNEVRDKIEAPSLLNKRTVIKILIKKKIKILIYLSTNI